ncbi:MAG: helix-hairpin-helix domain-containing protein, partial [Myxococcota bacterium]
PDIVRTVIEANAAPIIAVPGVGKKTAERVIIDLRDRMLKLDAALGEPTVAGEGVPPAAADADFEDALSALTNLGYRPQQAERVLKDVRAASAGAPLEALLRECLQRLSGLG